MKPSNPDLSSYFHAPAFTHVMQTVQTEFVERDNSVTKSISGCSFGKMNIRTPITVFTYSTSSCPHGNPASMACSDTMLENYVAAADAAAAAQGVALGDYRFRTYIWPYGGGGKPGCGWGGLAAFQDRWSYVHDGYAFAANSILHEWGHGMDLGHSKYNGEGWIHDGKRLSLLWETDMH
jgi:hypothetical protein